MVVAVLVAAVALLAASCSSDDTNSSDNSPATTTAGGGGDFSENVPVDAPGVTDTEINYSVLSSGTDPTGSCDLPCWATGVQAYFDYVNTERGGIWGRQLKADDLVDDEFGNNQQHALEIVSADKSFGVFGNATLPTGYPDIADAGIPLYVWASQPAAMVGYDGIFGEVTPRCLSVGCWDRAVPYQMKISGRHKLATIGYGIAQSSKDCAQNQAQSVAQSVDMIGPDAEAVYVNDNLAFGVPNGVAPEVTAMKNAGADIMATCIVNNDTKALMQEAERQGLDIVPVLPQGYDQAELDSMGGAFDGGYIRNNVRSFQADPLNEAQQKYLEYTAKNGGKVSEVSLYGWINAALAVKGLELAGPDFDQQKVIDATNTLTGFTADGMVFPQNWTTAHTAPTPDDASGHNPYECYSIMKVESSKFTLVGDPTKPFTCWPGDNWQWEDGWPQSMTFD